ncbi:cation:dicarboxylase symporter family transporter [Hymenobacter sp. BT683]|uniref:Cation:dicarboxylase symporter family transporter n=1 Tax=Hymenobacter jeongseonensis TaxID=2791027 RepID=A0ABS0IL15_9BACT|nr:cation:dicarboxylase symporter family transporter [Hymenobacter jeongseonensis]MBF9239058.1 cation:dicarboxylase symporter family transporter [Hymenobacter jeongseonensis]
MKFRKLTQNLTLWVLLAIVSGALLGHFAPATAVKTEFLGKWFIAVVKLFINPIIFLTITLGISTMGDLKKVGRIGGKALLYFEIVTTLALLIGVGVAALVKPGAGVAVGKVSGAAVGEYTKRAVEFSWLHFLADNFTLQVLLLSIVLGIVLSKYAGRKRIIHFLKEASKYVFRGLHLVMLLAPIGAFGGMAFTIGKFGIATLLPLGKLMATVYLTMAVFVFLILGGILRYCRIGMWSFLKYIKAELLIVLGTSSSEAGLPGLMEKLDRMGCAQPVVGLVVPTGYSFNLDGTTIYLSLATLFLAQVFHVDLSGAQLLTMMGILMVTSKGAAGVAGSGFVVLASTLTALKVIPVEGLALLLGVDRFMSEARSITNFIGNGVATVFLAHTEGALDHNLAEAALGKRLRPLRFRRRHLSSGEYLGEIAEEVAEKTAPQ